MAKAAARSLLARCFRTATIRLTLTIAEGRRSLMGLLIILLIAMAGVKILELNGFLILRNRDLPCLLNVAPGMADTPSKSRPRANTASFTNFGAWRRPKDPLAPPSVSPHSLSLDELIHALSPPAVPSLAHARVLAGILSTHSPLPRRSILNPILASLCSVDAPPAVQAAGYDIVSAYSENNEAAPLTTADRLSYFALFRGSTNAWAVELWEPRLKALRALTRYGTDIIGIELEFLEVLKSWIEGGFEGLLKDGGVVERTERSEREHSIDILVKFLADVLANVETLARISEEDLAAVLDFYAGLVDRSILLPNRARHQGRHFLLSSDPPSNINLPSKPPTLPHRRNNSSVSAASFSSSHPLPPPGPSQLKHPADLTISIYLDHLSSRLKTLSPTYLDSILPLLFRALAFCSSPLPRLSVLPHPARKATSEDKVTEMLNALFCGPYSTTCMRILKDKLFPPANPTDPSLKPRKALFGVNTSNALSAIIHTSLGAHRTFRNYVRRALGTRLARSYILRESPVGFSSGNLSLERELMERARPKEDYTSPALGLGRNGWDAARFGKLLTKSVEAWVWWQSYEGDQEELKRFREGKEDLLEEAAGILKDIWQEFDSRAEEDKGQLDEEEACVIGETLQKLVEYVLPLR